MDSEYLSCPKCYNGYIKYDDISDTFYCLNCHKEVRIIGYNK